MKHILWIAGALALAIVGGTVGAIVVVTTRPTLGFDLGGFFGTLLATALAAFLAHHLGLLDHFRRTQSERFLRRYLDEGLVAAADTLNASLQRTLANWKTAMELIGLTEAEVRPGATEYKAMRAKLQPISAGVPPPLFRVAEIFDSRDVFEALVALWTEIESIDTWATASVPVALEEIARTPASRDTGLDLVRRDGIQAGESLMELQAFIGTTLRTTAEDVEAAVLTGRVADLQTLRTSDRAKHLLETSSARLLADVRGLSFFIRQVKSKAVAGHGAAPGASAGP